jgi:hypothetical protein
MFCNGYTCFSSVFQLCCMCFRHMLQVFQLFRKYVISVSFGCCKSRSGVAHVTTGTHLLQLLVRRACVWEVEGVEAGVRAVLSA